MEGETPAENAELTAEQKQQFRESVADMYKGLSKEDKNLVKSYLQLDEQVLLDRALQFIDMLSLKNRERPKQPVVPTVKKPNMAEVIYCMITNPLEPLECIKLTQEYNNAQAKYRWNKTAYNEFYDTLDEKKKTFLHQYTLYNLALEMKRLRIPSGGARTRKHRRRKLKGKTRSH